MSRERKRENESELDSRIQSQSIILILWPFSLCSKWTGEKYEPIEFNKIEKKQRARERKENKKVK